MHTNTQNWRPAQDMRQRLQSVQCKMHTLCVCVTNVNGCFKLWQPVQTDRGTSTSFLCTFWIPARANWVEVAESTNIETFGAWLVFRHCGIDKVNLWKEAGENRVANNDIVASLHGYAMTTGYQTPTGSETFLYFPSLFPYCLTCSTRPWRLFPCT